ncbi:hypothetical protein [Streptomyces triticirhizae]|uniref:hypothetical protein n=1 Tax=Streptomyces triticirhizae TaxID=2483353 RepID=UPI0018F2E1EF|nr:hypothetical protein [Streptomyces triticirhizae]
MEGSRSPLALRAAALDRRLVTLLTGMALIRPLCSITGLTDALGRPFAPLAFTVAISLAWVLIVARSNAPDPLGTLVAAGLCYALAAIALSGVLSPLLDGELEGPLARPFTIAPLLAVNTLWGAACGRAAAALRDRRDRRDRHVRCDGR